MTTLTHKHILLGICGGIAAYKCPELVRELQRAGAIVKVIMTAAAHAFVTSTTLQALSTHAVYDDAWLASTSAAMDHISLARWADLLLLAPATADTIARLAHGHANDLLTTTCVATQAPIIVAPAMNQQMWQNALVQANIARLQQYGIQIIPPGIGEQACGECGPGRLPDLAEIMATLSARFSTPLLQDRRIIITAGPTFEAIDPVRFIGNHSSGKMGYALAQAAAELGAKVILISGPTALIPPTQVQCLHVTTATEMLAAVMAHMQSCDIFIAAAAVADYRPASVSSHKIKKSREAITLELIPNPDILATVAQLPQRPFVVGFAAETENLLVNAQRKLAAKKLDLLIANQVGAGKGFSVDENAVVILDKTGEKIELPLMGKSQLAREIMIVIHRQISAFN